MAWVRVRYNQTTTGTSLKRWCWWVLVPDDGNAEAGSVIKLNKMRDVFFQEIVLSTLPHGSARKLQQVAFYRVGVDSMWMLLDTNLECSWTASSLAKRRSLQSMSLGTFPYAIATPVRVHLQPRLWWHRCQYLKMCAIAASLPESVKNTRYKLKTLGTDWTECDTQDRTLSK
jgi:hypothetical protein